MIDRETMLAYADLIENNGQALLDLCAEIRADAATTADTLGNPPAFVKVVPLFLPHERA